MTNPRRTLKDILSLTESLLDGAELNEEQAARVGVMQRCGEELSTLLQGDRSPTPLLARTLIMGITAGCEMLMRGDEGELSEQYQATVLQIRELARELRSLIVAR